MPSATEQQDQPLYDSATQNIASGNDEAALTALRTLLDRYPKSQYKGQAQSMYDGALARVNRAAIKVAMDQASQKYSADTGIPVRKIGGGVSAPTVIYQVSPEYSAEAKAAKFNGIVLVNLIVDEKGMPQNVHVVRGVGNGLDEKAVESVKKYRFRPAREAGKPVPVMLNVEVNFQIF
jgi:TonB family protein